MIEQTLLSLAGTPDFDLGRTGLTEVLSAHYKRSYARLWMNWYRDDSDGTGWHVDRPANEQDEAVIPVLSLVVMGSRCQKDYQHSVPKQKQPAGARVSLNFSRAFPAG